MGGRCDVCDGPLLWGGMDYVEHTDQQHDMMRRRLVRYAMRVMQEKIAVGLGHTVVIRFTQEVSWPECSCGWVGLDWPMSSAAVVAGHEHLWEIGSILYWAATKRDILAGFDLSSV